MQNFFEWYTNTTLVDKRPWLVLGKGPSFDKYPQYDLSHYNLMSLNHVVERLPVDVAHILDLDVVLSCENAINQNAKFLVMPFVPHVKNKPGPLDLCELIIKHPFLKSMSDQGRLLFYNHLASRVYGKSPVVEVRYFSSEAAISILAMSGAHVIRTLGVDGGATYGKTFSNLSDITLLANGRKSFNKQFGQIAKIIMKTGVDLAPLDIQSPIMVYVATTEAQMLAVKVLEYSIRKHASMSVEVIPLHLNQIEVPLPKDKNNWPKTPFSFQRFLIPELQKYTGRAVYLDSDMQVFKDIKDLWVTPFNGAQVLTVKNVDASNRRPQFSVMLLDCENLRWSIKKIISELDNHNLSYENLMYEMAVAERINTDIDAGWNSLENFNQDQTSLLHYTDMNLQPWINKDNPLGYLWFRDLFEAIDTNFISIDFIKEHIKLGYVRPSLMYQVEKRIEDPLLLPKEAVQMDIFYKAPYQDLSHIKSNFSRAKLILKAYLRGVSNNNFFRKLKLFYSSLDKS